jgi:hypothetical protein
MRHTVPKCSSEAVRLLSAHEVTNLVYIVVNYMTQPFSSSEMTDVHVQWRGRLTEEG